MSGLKKNSYGIRTKNNYNFTIETQNKYVFSIYNLKYREIMMNNARVNLNKVETMLILGNRNLFGF